MPVLLYVSPFSFIWFMCGGDVSWCILESEHGANVTPKAGLNLNIFGALSGAFSSKSKKTTHRNKDGSSHEVEDRYEQGAFSNSLYSLSPIPLDFTSRRFLHVFLVRRWFLMCT